ncbi:hypothetical protein ACFS6H_19965 [Terrimonas rubra]|uniref:Uncharacterized protein n=1 Tax=Terrimonas rubra TaxID=1035890 RepID=A0ABW6ADG6_9BACT
MKNVTTIDAAGTLVRELFKDLSGTTYFTLSINDKVFKIRVSDHSANYANNLSNGEYDNYFSFVLNKNTQNGYGRGNMLNEWQLNENGEFTEEFESVEDCLDYQIN